MIIHKTKAENVGCEKLTIYNEQNIVTRLKVCDMSEKTSINAPNVTISTKRDESISGLNFNYNRKIFYLPIDVAEKFPYLTNYGAMACSISKISKLNFNGLNKLKHLWLFDNQIEKIDSDTFQDLVALETLDLGE
jgi:hypothetical protein